MCRLWNKTPSSFRSEQADQLGAGRVSGRPYPDPAVAGRLTDGHSPIGANFAFALILCYRSHVAAKKPREET